jgi:hypothetical protein
VNIRGRETGIEVNIVEEQPKTARRNMLAAQTAPEDFAQRSIKSNDVSFSQLVTNAQNAQGQYFRLNPNISE